MKLISELLNLSEGAYVIKNMSGVEKRFKNRNSDAALAWARTISKKKKTTAAKFTQTWWEDKDDGMRMVPWERIDEDEIGIAFLSKSMHTDEKSINYWSITGRGEKKLQNDTLRKMIDTSTETGKALLAKLQSREDLPIVATATVRVAMIYTKEDDLGHEDDVEEGQSIKIMRDPENPIKLVFSGYTW